MKKLIAILAALPLAAFAQGAGPQKVAGGPGMGQGRGWGPDHNPEMMQRRARLALTLGLATALDLDEAQALRLGDTVAKFTDRRRAIHEQSRDARQTLRRAAQGEKVSAQEVDQAIAKILDGRAQIQAIDRELLQAVTKDLPPDKKARAVLFLGKFQRHFGRGGGQHMMMMRRGPGGPGMQGGPPAGMDMERGGGPMLGAFGPDGDWDSED
ncbi:MAG TPA: hypothetical protein VIV57_12195 [Anaeromyxobacter sp.]